MNVRVCSNCGRRCGTDGTDHWLVCECDAPHNRIPGQYGGSGRDDTYDGNVFDARPVRPEEFRKR